MRAGAWLRLFAVAFLIVIPVLSVVFLFSKESLLLRSQILLFRRLLGEQGCSVLFPFWLCLLLVLAGTAVEKHRSPLSHCAVFGVTFFGSLSFDEALPPGTVVVLRHICGLVTGGTFPRKLTSGPWGSLCVPGKEVVQCSGKK